MEVQKQSAKNFVDTAVSNDKKNLVAEFQAALADEIAEAKKQVFGRKTELFEGKKIYTGNAFYAYRFLSDDAIDWRNRKRNTEVILKIEQGDCFGRLDSADKKSITITLNIDKGEFIEEATLEDTSFFLLEKLYCKLDKIVESDENFNLDGSLKLFGLKQSNSFPSVISENIESRVGLNYDQQIAVLKSLSQEVTFIWGPPGTGKTKTLTSLLIFLIKAGKKVLVTANTNAAIDEILKNLLENEEASKYVMDGKILRFGVPTFEHQKMDYVLPEKRPKKKADDSEDSVGLLQKEIDSLLNKKEYYEEQEKLLQEKSKQNEKIKQETNSINQMIVVMENRVRNCRSEIENNKNTISLKKELLEKNRTANVLKRMFQNIDKNQLEEQIRIQENEIHIMQLEILSENDKIDELKQKGLALQSKIFDLTVNDQATNEIQTIDSLRQRISELANLVKTIETEIASLRDNNEKSNVIKDAFLYLTTIARACIDQNISQIKFDTLLVDEASMASLPSVFYLAGRCESHYVVSGDFRQLSPIAQSKTPMAQKWLLRDIFTQAGIVNSVDSKKEDCRLVMLREQYRMHPDICNLISEVVYNDQLKTPEYIVTQKEQIAKLPPFEGKALVFCDTATTDPYIARPKGSFSRLSPYSAVVSAAIALKCVEEGAKKGHRISVGIVTPYKAQAKLIGKILEDKNADPELIMASTIHRFQGSERDCIIFDLVEGKPLYPGKLTLGQFKTSEPGRLVNVAISRARGKFILVGNSDYIAKNFSIDQAISQLLKKIQQNGETVDSNITGYWPFDDNSIFDTSRTYKDVSFTIYDQTNFYQALLDDMNKAKSKVVIFSPFVSKKRVETLLSDFQRIHQKGIPIYVITRKKNSVEAVEDLRQIGVNLIFASSDFELCENFDKFHFKVALVDNSVVYYGSLNILAQFESSESMIAFRSQRTVSQLIRNFGIDRILKEYLSSKNNKETVNSSQMTKFDQTVHAAKLDSLLFSNFSAKKQDQPVDEQKNTFLYEEYISKGFGNVEPGPKIRDYAKARLRDLGVKKGFDCFVDYAVDNLLGDVFTRYISVTWMKGGEIIVAFQVIEQEVDAEKKMFDIIKIKALQAKEKYLIEISSINGSSALTRINTEAFDLLLTQEKCSGEVTEASNVKIEERNTQIQRPDSFSAETICKAFGRVSPGKDVRKNAQLRLWQIGKNLGFNSYTEYEVPNLLNDGYNRFISVIWKEGSEIRVAFQVRRRKRGIDVVTSLHDTHKLKMLAAKEKYIVNVSQKDGSAAFFKVTEYVTPIKTENPQFRQKSYGLDIVRLKYPRAYESWSDSEDHELINQYNQGMSIAEIAKVHQRQKSAIRARIKKKIRLK